MDSTQSQLVKKYLDLFGRRKILIITLLLLSLPVGLGYYIATPKVYQATSLLSYQQQKINPNKMSPDVASRIRDIVSTLTQIVTSRTSLEAIITNQQLYLGARAKLPMEDVVEMMRKHISIKPLKRGDVFNISFSGGNPGQVVKVTNALAAKFIEENLKYRQERASETSSYTSDELRMAKQIMDRKENAMRDYKLKYFNEMPDQRDANVARLIALQEQYQGKQENIQNAERTLILIQDQINSRRQFNKNSETSSIDVEGNSNAETVMATGSSAERLIRLENIQEQLLIKYTDKHPEVKRIRKIIAKLEVEFDEQNLDQENSSDGQAKSIKKEPKKKIEVVDEAQFQLESQKKSIELSIANIRLEKEQLKEKIIKYEQWVGSAPIREAEWSGITREYGQLKRHYDYLVSQDLQAKSMLNLERRQKGSQFKIEDSARFPEKPIKPKFFAIMGAAILAGLGLGCGLTLGLDFFDVTFRNPDTLEKFLGVPLITSIPYIETKKEKKWYKARIFLTVSLLGAGVLLIGALFYYTLRKGYIVF